MQVFKKNLRRFAMKNKRAFHASLVSVLFLSFLLVGVTVASAAPPDVQNTYSTENASVMILTGTPPDQVGVVVGGVGMVLNITAQTDNLYWGTLAVNIPTTPDPTVVTALITGFITDGGKMTITIVDEATGTGIGTMTAAKDQKILKNGVMQLFGGSVTTFKLKKVKNPL
jgi:phosphoenolpyruvate synthase/pyruvate phosphate dikinase